MTHMRLAFVSYALTLRKAEDAVRLLTVVREGRQALGTNTCHRPTEPTDR